MPAAIPSGPPSLILLRPGTYELSLSSNGSDYEVIGRLFCYLVDPPPLTQERITAIRSDPYAAKAARIDLGCNFCTTKLLAYAGLEQMPKLESEGYTWFSDIPSKFECSCKKTKFDLSSIKRNLQAALDGVMIPHGSGDYRTESYTTPSISPALRILTKPNILSRFTADFAILTPQRELIFIEIEKASTRLLKKNGGEAADLTHAFDQVRDWLHVIDEHRLAVLAMLDISAEQVSTIKGLVIAGRERGQNAKHLHKLRSGANRERIAFLTFDDLTSGLALLADKVGRV